MGVELDRICQVVEEIVQSEGYELVDVELKGAGQNRILRIFIDRTEGISHSDCGLISEQVGTVLEVEDLIPFSYTLEVSSPGLDRKLVKDSDYERFEGSLAKVQTKFPLNNQKVFKGRLRGLHGDKVQVELEGGELLELPLDVIKEARLEVDWPLEKARARERVGRRNNT
jgi:ribosome maturation factor RimP